MSESDFQICSKAVAEYLFPQAEVGARNGTVWQQAVLFLQEELPDKGGIDTAQISVNNVTFSYEESCVTAAFALKLQRKP